MPVIAPRYKRAAADLLMIYALLAVGGGLSGAGELARMWNSPETAPACEVGQWPETRDGFAALQTALGVDIMGQAVDCEHAVDASGDTEQRMSLGLAHYDQTSNTPAFTYSSSSAHWALTLAGLVKWEGPGSDWRIPASATAVPSPGWARLNAVATANAQPAVLVVATAVVGAPGDNLGIAQVRRSLVDAQAAGAAMRP